MGNRSYCYPLTISDHWSRYVICCEALQSTKSQEAIPAFMNAFKEYGLPQALRSDNGSPFYSSRSLHGLTRLSVWWLRLGLRLERIRPGHPEQNGRHERFHRTLKEDAIQPSSPNILHQQEVFDRYRLDFNEKRPHEAIEMNCPAQIYKPSQRPFPDELDEVKYQDCEYQVMVSSCGSIHPPKTCRNEKVFIGEAFSDQPIGLKQDHDDIWEVKFMDYVLGHYDAHEGVFHRIEQSPPSKEQPNL
jgi:hypothetical protein